jgi:Shikimate 5'-dehydrogenase C-terminal domain
VLARLIPNRTGVHADPIVWEGMYRVPEGTDLVVNVTSIELYPDTTARVPIDTSTLHPTMVVCDVIPKPPRTRLITDAIARACTVLDGLRMLVNQGRIAVKHWTGLSPRPEIMRHGLESIFVSQSASHGRPYRGLAVMEIDDLGLGALTRIEREVVHSCFRSVNLGSRFYKGSLKRSDSSDTFCSVVIRVSSIAV